MKSLSSNKGLTMLDLILYMVAVVIVIGILASIRSFFFNNMDIIKETARYAQEFDNFNAYFVNDVKKNEDVVVEQGNGADVKLTLYPSGTVYNYKKYSGKNIGDVYRESIKVATNVKVFGCSKKIIYINNTKKVLLKVNLEIGGNADNSTVFKKAIQYTFKYW